MRTPRRGTVADDWSSEVSSGLALAGFLAVVFVAFTLLAMGPLARFDAYFNLDPPPGSVVPVLHVIDRIGQRAVCLPILGVVTYLACRHEESWRPAAVAAASVFSLNLVVLVLKVVLGRSHPVTADPSFFNGGMAYPSGHTANIVLVYGLMVYLLHRYHGVRPRTEIALGTLVVALSVTMVATSLTLDWHWFADLVAGLLVGGIVLQLTASVDRMVPDDTTLLDRWQGLATAVRGFRRRARRPSGRR